MSVEKALALHKTAFCNLATHVTGLALVARVTTYQEWPGVGGSACLPVQLWAVTTKGTLIPPGLSCPSHPWVSPLWLQAELFGWGSRGLVWSWSVSGAGEAGACCLPRVRGSGDGARARG